MLSVTAAIFAGGSLTLVGDAANDTISVSRLTPASAVTVTANTAFTLNGVTSTSHSLAYLNRLTLRLNAGDDSATISGVGLISTLVDLGTAIGNQNVTVQNSSTGALSVSSIGLGNTGVSLYNVTSTTATISTGEGTDTLLLGTVGGLRTSGSVWLRTNGGADVVTLAAGGLGTHVGGLLSIDTGLGSDTVQLVGATINGAVSLSLRDGNNIAQSILTNVQGSFTVTGLTGNDVVAISDSQVRGTFVAALGNGNDTINLNNSDFLSTSSVRGELGVDTAVAVDSFFGSTATFDGGGQIGDLLNVRGSRFAGVTTATAHTMILDDSTFLANFKANTKGTGSVIVIETDPTALAATEFYGRADFALATGSIVTFGINSLSSTTNFRGAVRLVGTGIAGTLNVMLANANFFAGAPILVNVSRFDF